MVHTCFSKPSSIDSTTCLAIKSVRLEGSIISLDGFQPNGLERLLKPFPVCLDGDRSPTVAVLVYMGCMEARMYLHSFAEELFAGKPLYRPHSFPNWILI